MTSPNAPFALRGLGSVLDADLERSTVREWLDERHRAALESLGAKDARVGSAFLTVGRLLRSGDLSRTSRERLGDWWSNLAHAGAGATALVTAAFAEAEQRIASVSGQIAGLLAENGSAQATLDLAVASGDANRAELASSKALSRGWSQELVLSRDDIESCVVALGHAALAEVPGAAEGEQRLLSALEAVDGVAEALEYEIGAAIPGDWQDRWLSRIARVDDSSWWLQILATHDMRRDSRVQRTLDRLASRPARSNVVKLSRAKVQASASLMMGKNEPGGIDALLEKPLDAAIAHLFGESVEVYAVTEDQDTLSGLLVRERDGALSRIVEVKLSPPGPVAPVRSDVDLAFWVPLAGTADAPRELVVRYKRGDTEEVIEESLSVEFE